jgi:rhomboid protease GluP
MSYVDSPARKQDDQRDSSTDIQVRLPFAKPVVTYVLLAAIAVCFGLETLFGGSTSTRTLVLLGAQVNMFVAAGEYWRLVTAMFLHIGLAHLAFNMYALFILGRDIEGFYGSLRFATIYFSSGIAGNVAYYVAGPNAVSAGASGAIFGLVGAEIAFLISNRTLFGTFSKQRLLNLAFLVVINLALGFRPGSGINNLAHLGGLVSGLVLGFALTPRHRVAWEWNPSGAVPRLVDGTPRWAQIAAVIGAGVLLALAVLLGGQRWAAQLPQ